MKGAIPSRPALLVAFLGCLLSGDEKHQQDSVLTPELRAELIARKAQLETLDNRIQLSKGQLRQDTQTVVTWSRRSCPSQKGPAMRFS